MSRSGPNDEWFDIWVSMSSNTQPQFAFSLQVIEMYSFVVKVLSASCHSTLNNSVLTVQVVFNSKDDAIKFRYEEIFLKSTRLLTSTAFNFHARALSYMVPWRVSIVRRVTITI